MGIRSKKCVRCGEKTREKSGGIPTCEKCLATLSADREERRACPIDGSEMQKRIISNVVVDKCPKCLGFWLDRGELGLLSNAFADERAKHDHSFAEGFIVGMLVG